MIFGLSICHVVAAAIRVCTASGPMRQGNATESKQGNRWILAQGMFLFDCIHSHSCNSAKAHLAQIRPAIASEETKAI